MASTSTTANPELPRQSSICSLSTFITDLHTDRDSAAADGDDDDEAGDRASRSLAAMDDFLSTIYSDSPQPMEPIRNPDTAVGVDEEWKRVVAGGGDRRPGDAGDGVEMTLEDFLSKSGVVRENEGVRVPVAGGGEFGQFQGGPMVVYGVNGNPATAATGRGKRRAVEEPVDKATQQKQNRMIKNRESAARSRERKQAYTVELESLVTQLEEENAGLMREEAERDKERYKQLMERLTIVESKEKSIMESFFPEEKRREERIRVKIDWAAPNNRKLPVRPVLRRCYSAPW